VVICSHLAIDGRIRVRRRSARRVWRRLPALAARVEVSDRHRALARASIASWFGLAAHANAFRLSRAIFCARDVGNMGKRLLITSAISARQCAGVAGI